MSCRISPTLWVLVLASVFTGSLWADAWSDRMDSGRSAGRRGDFRRAAGLYREALALVEPEGVSGARLALTLNELAIALSQAGRNVEAARVLERLLSISEANLGKEHATVGRVAANLAQARRKAGQVEAALPLFERAVAIGRKTLPPQDPELASRLMGAGVIHHSAGRLDKARSLYDEVLSILDRPGNRSRQDLVACLGKLAELQTAKGDTKGAEKSAERGVKESIAAFGPASNEALLLTDGLGCVHRATGQTDREVACWGALIAAIDASRPVDERALILPLHRITCVHWRLGESREAGRFIRRSHALRLKLFAENHPAVALSEEELGALAEVEGRRDEARRHYATAVAIWNRIGVEDARAIHALETLGGFLAAAGETKQGKSMLKRAFEASRATLGPDHLRLAEIMDRMGAVLEREGDRSRAIKIHERALERWKKGLGDGHPQVATRAANVGRLYLAIGSPDRAEKLTAEAMGSLMKTVGPDHPDTAALMETHAGALRALGHAEKAKVIEAEAAVIRKREAQAGPGARTQSNGWPASGGRHLR